MREPLALVQWCFTLLVMRRVVLPMFAVLTTIVGLTLRAELPVDAARQASRYTEILRREPTHEVARKRLWAIHREAGETSSLLDQWRNESASDPGAGLILGYLLLESGDSAGAIAAFEGIISRDSNDAAPWIGLTAAHEALNDPSAAATALARALELTAAGDPDRQKLLVHLGEKKNAAGDQSGAIAAWEEAVAANPNDAALRRLLVEKYSATGAEEKALPHLEWLAVNAQPADRVPALVATSRIWESRGHFTEAIGFVIQGLALLGTNHWQRPDLERRVVDLHAKAGTLEAHVAGLHSDVATSPRDPRAHLRLANVLATLARRDEQLAVLREAHAILPQDAAITSARLEAEADFGDLPTAIALAESAIARRPADPNLVFLRADLDVRAGQMNAATARLETLLAAAPSDETLAARVLSFFERHRLSDALRRHLAQRSSGTPETSRMLAQLDFATGSATAGARTLLETDFAALGPEAGALAAMDAAALLREQGLLDEAIIAGQQAVTLDPENSDAARALAALLATADVFAEAEAILESAILRNPVDAESLDRHLLQLLESAPDVSETEADATLVESLFAAEQGLEKPPGAAARKAASLREALTDAANPAAWLRAARWEEWSEDPDEAADVLDRAMIRFPDAPELRENAARLAAAQEDLSTAITHYESVARLAPERHDEIQRRIAELEADRGNFDRALEIFAARADADPPSVEALTDLAGAQQRANDWYRALDTWLRAFAMASPAQRAQMRQPVLAVAERLAMPARGVSVLATFAASQPDEASQIAGWEETVDYAVSHQALNELRPILRAELQRQPRLYSLATARAALETASGRPGRAFEILSQSVELADDQAGALNRSFEAALAAGDQSAAIRIASRLADRTADPSNWRQLADLLESQGQTADAIATWRGIRRKFSRDPTTLTAAAAFYRRQGLDTEAADCLYAAAAIEPASPLALAEAGRFALSLGDRERAIENFQLLLAVTRPSGDALPGLPGYDEITQQDAQRAFSTAMRALGGLSEPETIATVRDRIGGGDASDAGLRLEAIRAVGRLSRGGASHAEWLDWCRDANSGEAVWGLYESGATAEALARLKSWPDKSDDAARRSAREQAFIWIALRGGDYSGLRDWIEEDTETRRRRTEFLFLALSRALQTHTITLDVAELFPSDRVPNAELWQAAWLLAAHSDIHAAAVLGDAALPDTPAVRRASAALQLASWHLLLRNVTAAVATLESVDRATTSGYEQPEFAALRMRWLLADPDIRQKIQTRIAETTDDPPAWRLAALGLLAALNGETGSENFAPQKIVQAWLAQNYGSDFSVPFDSVVRSSILQLLAWDLPDLALAICDAAGKIDPALIVLRGGNIEPWESDLAIFRVVAAAMTAPPRETPFLLDRHAGDFDASQFAAVARQLEVHGYVAAARQVRERQRNQFPNDPSVLPDLIVAASRSRDDAQRAHLLADLLDSGSLTGNFQAVTEQTIQLGDLLVRVGDPKKALIYLDRALVLAPADPALVRAKDRALASLGDTEGRIVLAQSQEQFDPANSLILARLLLSTGRESDAAAIAGSAATAMPSRSSETGTIRIEAALLEGDTAAAASELRQLAARDAWSEVSRHASALASAGDTATATSLLRQGLATATKPEDQFACGAALINLLPSPIPVADVEPILDALRATAESNSALIPRVHQLETKLAQSNPALREWLHRDLTDAWKNGAGSRMHGEKLIQLAINAGDESVLASLLDEFLVPRHFHASALTGLAELLTQSGQHAAAARVYSILVTRNPGQTALVIGQARELWLSGQQADALALIDPWLQTRWFDPAMHRELADFFVSVGARDRAIELLSEIVAGDPGVTQPAVWRKLARLVREAGRPEEAELYLRTSILNPENVEWSAVVEHLEATADLAALDPETNAFQLSPALWRHVRTALATRLLRDGHAHRALQWITPSMLVDPAAAGVLVEIATLNQPDRTAEAAKLWDTARRELPDSRALRQGHARFLTTRAQTAGESVSSIQRLEWLIAAHDASPELGATAQMLAGLLQQEGRTAEARKVLETLILTDATAEDRAEARATLSEWETTADLPPGGPPA